MGRRQIRIRQPEGPAAVQAHVDAWVDVNLVTGETLHGKLVATDAAGLVLEDHSQMWPRRAVHRRQVPWATIREFTLAPFETY